MAVKASKTQKPDIFYYEDYRHFIMDFYTYLKNKHANLYSFREFSRSAGFRSSSFLKHIVDGEKNLSEKSAAQLAIVMQLNSDETDFFKALVRLDQEGASANGIENLLRFKKYKNAYPLRQAQLKYYKEWYYVAIRELIGTKNFKEDPKRIANSLCPKISPQQAKAALKDLEKLKFVKRDESGRLIQSNPHIRTDDRVSSQLVKEFHKKMLDQAKSVIDGYINELAPKKKVSGLTFGISAKGVEELKQLLDRQKQDIIELIQRHEVSDCVYQLSFQLFPLSEGDDDES